MTDRKSDHNKAVEHVLEVLGVKNGQQPEQKDEKYYLARHRSMLAEVESCVRQLKECTGNPHKLDSSPESLVFLDSFVLAQKNLIPEGAKNKRGEPLHHTKRETWLITRLGYYLADVLRKNLGMEWHLVLGNKNNAQYGETVLKDKKSSIMINPLRVAFNIWHESGGIGKNFSSYYTELENIQGITKNIKN